NRSSGYFELKRTVLVANDRVAFVAEFVKALVVDPHVLREFKLADQARTNDEGRDAALDAIIGGVLRELRAIGCTAADHPTPVHVCRRVARIHAADVRTQ